jgi:hypothetical protein
MKFKSDEICCEKGRGGRAKNEERHSRASSEYLVDEDGRGSEKKECHVTIL